MKKISKESHYQGNIIAIDGLYKNNVRVAVLEDNILKNFEFETLSRQTLRGNIYLAKVSRVENSLQAAFVDYGEEKNGFLSFSEIHPDNFQIPMEDKKKFTEEITYLYEQNDAESSQGIENKISSLYKSFNIGEVIKKDQLLLVQVIKEERGNKGASLTTYLTFPGRYFALMTNTPRHIGISKKISNIQERGRIREIVSSFGIAKSSGIVVRTVAENKSKEELLKDYNYLASLWNSVREKTVQSQAPAFIHSEEGIVKKIVRDCCDSTIQEILIEGEEIYNEVNNVAENLGINKSVKITKFINKVPIFTKLGIENQIGELFSSRVGMPSGAYLIIQQTEALVSIDVNSGKVTTGNSIEETALQTNLEAAKEIVRQIKIRKLSGLIVIDFIDMLKLNNRIAVENEIKSSFARDKSRVHVGRISQFGLLELSRQRTDQSMFEACGTVCEACNGVGLIKSIEYLSMNILRGIASHLTASKVKHGKFVAVYLQPQFLVYIMNFKRKFISILESKYNTRFIFYVDQDIKSESFKIEYNHTLEHSVSEGEYFGNIGNSANKNDLAKSITKKSFFARLFGK